MQKYAETWPDDFRFARNETCQRVFKPFINVYLEKLADLDARRPADITYIFHEHVMRVANDVRQICLHMGLGDIVADNMYWAALPHDIGKTALPVHIWDVDGKPDADLKTLRRTHTNLGADIARRDLADTHHPFKDLMIDIIMHHHEEMDGGGTHGLTGEKLSLPVRLISIVEAFDGWSIPRPHFGDRDISPTGVIARMRNEKMHMFDTDLFNAFADAKLKSYKPS